MRATSGFFDVMGVRPLVGRGFLPQEDNPGHGQVVVLSERLWRERFGADINIAGRRILLDERSFDVVGVMPETFNFPPVVLGNRVDYWAPIAEPIRNYRGRHYLYVVARLKRDVALDQARADMQRVAANLRNQFPDLNRGHEAFVVPLQGDLMRDAHASLWLLLGAVFSLLLIGCSNIAGLLLARGFTRHHELSVRLAIGGTRLDIARQLLTESLILAASGGILGVAVTYWFTQTIPALIPSEVLALDRVAVDRVVLTFALAMALGTGLLFGLAPSLQVRHINVGAMLQQAGRTIVPAGRARSRRALVALQVAVTLVLCPLRRADDAWPARAPIGRPWLRDQRVSRDRPRVAGFAVSERGPSAAVRDRSHGSERKHPRRALDRGNERGAVGRAEQRHQRGR